MMTLYEYRTFSIGGGIKGLLQQLIPVYRIYNGEKKHNALRQHGREILNVDKNTYGWIHLLANYMGSLPGTFMHIVTSSRFEDLCDDLTKEFLKKHPEADRDIVKKAIKYSLYHDLDTNTVYNKYKGDYEKKIKAKEDKLKAKADKKKEGKK